MVVLVNVVKEVYIICEEFKVFWIVVIYYLKFGVNRIGEEVMLR